MLGLLNRRKPVVRTDVTVPAAKEASWASILSRAEASTEAISALNVRVVVELAPLNRSPEKYEIFRREALRLASSIHDESRRTFALEQLNALFRSAEGQGGPTAIRRSHGRVMTSCGGLAR
jgi:hypothetical protein